MNQQLHTEETQKNIGLRLKAFRKYSGLTLADISESLEVTRAGLSMIEMGHQSLSMSWVRGLAMVYGVNPLYLMLFSDEMFDHSLKSS